MRYRNDVIRSVFLLHICANLGMMLARDYASCHVARSTVTFNVCSKQRAKNLDGLQKVLNLNPIDTYLLDLSKRKVCAHSLQLNLVELTRVIHQMSVVIS